VTAEQHGGRRPSSGHRTVPHTGDMAVEAWAVDREACIAEAVRGAIAGFADVPLGLPRTLRVCELTVGSDEQLLIAALEEVIYRLEVDGELPAEVTVESSGSGSGIRLRLAMVGSASVTQVGAVPKAVAWHGLRLARDSTGWSCRVTLDV